MKGTAVQPLLCIAGAAGLHRPGHKHRSCFWTRLQEKGTASMSWDHLPRRTRTCAEGWLLLQEGLG